MSSRCYIPIPKQFMGSNANEERRRLGQPLCCSCERLGLCGFSQQQLLLWSGRYELGRRACLFRKFNQPLFKGGCGADAVAWTNHDRYFTLGLPGRTTGIVAVSSQRLFHRLCSPWQNRMQLAVIERHIMPPAVCQVWRRRVSEQAEVSWPASGRKQPAIRSRLFCAKA